MVVKENVLGQAILVVLFATLKPKMSEFDSSVFVYMKRVYPSVRVRQQLGDHVVCVCATKVHKNARACHRTRV